MTQEEKQLLLRDLSARLPYGVIIHTWYNRSIDIKCTGIDLYTNTVNLDIPKDDDAKVYIDNVKPYLRPMSSMTEEEESEYLKIVDGFLNFENAPRVVDWLNTHHFDYRDLIEKGLAIEAPEDMYK